MKKIRKIFALIIFVIIVLFMYDNNVYAISWNELANKGASAIGERIYGVRLNAFVYHRDLYCAMHSGHMTNKYDSTYEISDYVEIKRFKCYGI